MSKNLNTYKMGDDVEITIKSAKGDFAIILIADDVVFNSSINTRDATFSLKVKNITVLETYTPTYTQITQEVKRLPRFKGRYHDKDS